MIGYGSFDIVLGVPNDYDKHRCEYARSVLRKNIGEELVQALVIQKTIPVDPVDADDDKDYYEFGGNVKLDRISQTTITEP